MPKGGSKPGGPQSKNLVPVNKRDPERARQIRAAGARAATKAVKEKKARAEIFREFLELAYDGSRVTPAEQAKSLEAIVNGNTQLYAKILAQEFQRYMATGDKESRDWLISNAFPQQPGEGNGEQDGKDGGGTGTRIHLIRGDKPTQDEKPDPGGVSGG